jgi:hypothetical protein
VNRAERYGWIAGGIGLSLSLFGWILEPRVFPHAWLAAFYTWMLWPLGSMAVILAHALTRGRWGEAARPGLLLGVSSLPLLLPAVVPLLCTMPVLYDWARAGAHVPNGFYLNPPAFAARGVLYLLVWFGLALVILAAERRGRTLRFVAAPGLILLAVSFSFAVIDLTMSLQDFTSTIYPMTEAASAGLLALAVATLVGLGFGDEKARDDLSKLLLALIVLWTYLDFMQLLIVWESDLAADGPYYLRRTDGYWDSVMALVEIGRFVVPFFLLLSPRGRRSKRVLGVACILVVVTAILRGWWLVLPAAHHAAGRGIGWIDLAAMLAFGGASFAWIARGDGLSVSAMHRPQNV